MKSALGNEDKKVFLSKENFELIAKSAFNVADKDNNGTIDVNELGNCMKDVAKGFDLSLPEQEKIMKKFDSLDLDKNGTIDFEEFKIYVMDIIYSIINGEE